MEDRDQYGKPPQITTRRNSNIPADVLEVAYQIPMVEHRKRCITPRDDHRSPTNSPKKTIIEENKQNTENTNTDISKDQFANSLIKIVDQQTEIENKEKMLARLFGIEIQQSQVSTKRKHHNFVHNSNEDKKSLFEKILIPPKYVKPEGKLQNITYSRPKNKNWKVLSESYKQVPNQIKLPYHPTVLDFIGNLNYRCFWPDGHKQIQNYTDDPTPPTMPVSILKMSESIDLFSISDVDVQREELKLIITKDGSVDHVVRRRMELEQELAGMMDCRDFAYSPAPEFRGALNSEYPTVSLQNFGLALELIHVCDLNAEVMAFNDMFVVTRSLGAFVPFMKLAAAHPELDTHLVGTSAHAAFFFFLLHAVRRVQRYLDQVDFVETRLAYEVSKKCGGGLPFTRAEAARFAASVDKGAALSVFLRLLQLASVAHSLPAALGAYDCARRFMIGLAPDAALPGLAAGRLYAFRFDFGDGRLAISARPFEHRPRPVAAPAFWPAANRFDTEPSEISAVAERSELRFRAAGDAFRPLRFVPGTTMSVFV